jgi:hypothetical protein
MRYLFFFVTQKTASESVKPFLSYGCLIESTRDDNLFNLRPLSYHRAEVSNHIASVALI